MRNITTDDLRQFIGLDGLWRGQRVIDIPDDDVIKAFKEYMAYFIFLNSKHHTSMIDEINLETGRGLL